MTGTTSSTGRSFFDIDAHRNQEWLRRRKLRLEQVRRQSNEIAKALREKVINHEKARLEEYDRISEAKFNKWKAEKLDELERKLICALEEFGESYKMAEEEPDTEELMQEKYQINLAKAQIRGEIAIQEEVKRKKIAEENKMSAIQRKKLVRKKEDLRSALVHSVPVKKQIIENQKLIEGKIHTHKVTPTLGRQKIIEVNIQNMPKKACPNKLRRKKLSPKKSCKCKHKGKSLEMGPNRGGDTIWINLNEIQNSTGDSERKPRSSKSSDRSEKNLKEPEKGAVEFYDFSSRYYCRSFKEFPHSVERINSESKVPNATDLAKVEDEMEKAEAKKRTEADVVSQERGMEALRREKINQDFNNLVTKLEELSRKEKILKAQQRNLPSFLHMSDERLVERLKTKQRLMDSKFESICYEVVSQMPRKHPPEPKLFSRKGGGDYKPTNRASTRLSFSPGCLKLNTPNESDGDPSLEQEETFRKPKELVRKRQLLVDIDAVLKEGRELRKAAYKSQNSTSGNDATEEEDEKENSEKEGRSGSVEVSPRKEEEKATRSQESQTEDLREVEPCAGNVNAKIFEKMEDDSLPVSTSTSYKSPPSVIKSSRLRQFLDYLGGMSEAESSGLLESNPKSNEIKINQLFHDLLQTNNFNEKSNEKDGKSGVNLSLEYYIEKLLNMSRESVAELSVSSENLSTPNITDLEVRDTKPPVPVYFATVSSREEDFIRKSNLERADQLEKSIRNWKRILEKDLEHSEPEDVPDCPRVSLEESPDKKKFQRPSCLINSPKIKRRYEEITKKCSERISELSNMLDKVRKDKKKLLTSASDGSSGSLSKNERNSVMDLNLDVEDGEVESLEGNSKSLEDLKTSVVEQFLNRYSLQTPRKETVSTTAVVDSQSLQDFEDSLESWPDVMDELIKRKILTSPFKWSDGEYSSELTTVSANQTKPSSIETVIGNFRREINKIKPFTLSDSFPHSNFPTTTNTFDDKSRPLFGSQKSKTSLGQQLDNEKPFLEESSMESINQALTNLGLNWAKSFLRKNEESKAINSSSNSEGETSSDEVDG